MQALRMLSREYATRDGAEACLALLTTAFEAKTPLDVADEHGPTAAAVRRGGGPSAAAHPGWDGK